MLCFGRRKTETKKLLKCLNKNLQCCRKLQSYGFWFQIQTNCKLTGASRKLEKI